MLRRWLHDAAGGSAGLPHAAVHRAIVFRALQEGAGVLDCAKGCDVVAPSLARHSGRCASEPNRKAGCSAHACGSW